MQKLAVLCVLAWITVLAHCQQTVSVSGAGSSVESTNWPSKYMNDEVHRWTFKGADLTKKLRVHFDNSFSIEQDDSGWCFDFVAIYDGPAPPTKVCDRYSEATIKACGQTPPADFETKTSTITVDFCTDFSVTDTGFKMTVSQPTSDSVTTPSGDGCNTSPPSSPNTTPITTVPTITTTVGTGARCGMPDVQYPPALTINGDNIVGMAQSIVGGKEVVAHSYPWQVWLVASGRWSCGASLIDPSWVLTAAHCVEDGGVWDWLQVIMHSQYGVGSGNDIALIKLATPASITPKVKPICLPTSSDSWRKDTSNVVVSGWGTLSQGGSTSQKLQHVVLQCDITQCMSAYQSMRPIADNEMCATGPSKDSCQGDSGGPLIARKNGRYVLAGVVSWGYGCAKAGYPGVYAHVPYYRDWIQQKSGL